MTADQSGDKRPSLQDLIKQQLDPLYQQEAMLGAVQKIASAADSDIRQRIKEEQQVTADTILARFDVREKLRQLKKVGWRRGLIESIEEDVAVVGGEPNHRMRTGFRLSYTSLAVAAIQFTTDRPSLTYNTAYSSVRPGVGQNKYDFNLYVPTSETQGIDARVKQGRNPQLIVESYSRLNIPEDIKRGLILDHDRRHDFGVAYISGEPFDDPLIWWYIPKDREVVIRLTQLAGYDSYRNILELGKNDNITLLDEFLAQDCVERFKRDKLPIRAKESWSRYIKGADSQEVFIHRKLLHLNPKKINVTGSRERFKIKFQEYYGMDFDDVADWMWEAPTLGRIDDADISVRDRLADTLSEYKDLMTDLQLDPNNQELIGRRDRLVIRLLHLGGHHLKIGFWPKFESI